MDHIKCYADIEHASREALVAYLESWGTACYDYESTALLREAAQECWLVEGC